MKKIIIFTVALFLNLNLVMSQVESVNYKLQYNNESGLFDCYLVVNEGSAKKTRDRAQFNAQITLVAPTQSNIYITESYMPLIDNQDSRSEVPANWEVSNEIESPNQLEDSRLVSIFPELLPTAFYNDLNVGDEVRLFSFKVTPMVDCAKDIRFYNNDQDPTSIVKGMGGSDFRNGFTMGGVNQKYAGNSATVFPTKPVIKNLDFSMKNRINLDIDMAPFAGSAAQKELTYAVVAPNGKQYSYEEFLASNTNDILRGDYTVIATDNIGCSAEKRFNPFGSSTELEAEVVATVSDFNSGIYPNPAQNAFALTLNGAIGTKVSGDIINLEGKVVKRNIVDLTLSSNEEVINIDTNLTPGMYSLSLTVDNSNTVNHKLLIIK